MLELDVQSGTTEGDRRAHARVRVDRPCKLHDPRSNKYLAATARDLSAGGVLLEIERPLDVAPGERLYLGIAQKRRQMFLRSDEMNMVHVVRAMGTPEGRMILAARWADEAVAEPVLRKAA